MVQNVNATQSQQNERCLCGQVFTFPVTGVICSQDGILSSPRRAQVTNVFDFMTGFTDMMLSFLQRGTPAI